MNYATSINNSDAPPGPRSGFGRETTLEDMEARIAWESWAAAKQRETGHEALAQGHDLAGAAYQELKAKKFSSDPI